uniref:Uncharacterized protein n=1 Tax=Rhizophora mucronata TaxID=61149 RepID=A0A2P2P8U4_RHIMU
MRRSEDTAERNKVPNFHKLLVFGEVGADPAPKVRVLSREIQAQ